MNKTYICELCDNEEYPVPDGMTFGDFRIYHKTKHHYVDMVNHPPHYMLEIEGSPLEVKQLIEEVLTPEEYRGYLKGNIIKYILRAPNKNGDEDYKKAEFYLRELNDSS